MDVHRATGEGARIGRRENSHEPGVAHQADTAPGELPDEGQVERFAVAEVLGVHEERLDARGAGAIQGCRALPIRDDHDDLSGVARPRRRIQKRLEIRAPSGDQNADPQTLARGGHAVSSTPRSPGTISPIRVTCSPALRSIRAAASAAEAGTITT